jgi:hypothetical protein
MNEEALAQWGGCRAKIKKKLANSNTEYLIRFPITIHR